MRSAFGMSFHNLAPTYTFCYVSNMLELSLNLNLVAGKILYSMLVDLFGHWIGVLGQMKEQTLMQNVRYRYCASYSLFHFQ